MADLAELLRNTDPNNGFDPYSGKVTLQKLSDPNNPFSESTNVNYTIPKESIKQFVPNEEGLGGQYILNDGSTMYVSGEGVVQSATPGRSDYTLNAQGYYQPTGSDLTWRGDQNTLTKNIGGVEVQVPGIYHKGGYKDAQGNLRVDANGVPIALAPNYLDSGFGESSLSDAAPYITALTMAAMGMPTGAMAFEGMVPASETLLGGYGTGAGLTTTEMMNGAGGAFTPSAGSGASFAIEPEAAYTTAGAGGAFEGANPSVFDAEDMAYGKSFPEGSVPKGSGIFGNTYGKTGLSAMQKAMLIRSGMNSLNQMTGGTGGGGYSNMSGGYGNGMQAYQRQNPFLSTAQQNTVPDSTTAALTKLLRGYNG